MNKPGNNPLISILRGRDALDPGLGVNKPGNNLLLCILLLALPAIPGWAGAATISVHADRNPAVLQESFQLLFEASGEVDADPDFSPLERDFQVLSTSVSASMSIVNTQITRTKQWRLILLPKNVGNMVIPAISFGKDSSPQTPLTVLRAGTGAPGQDSPDLFMEVEAVPESAYVQAEVVYTIKLYRAVATSNETLSEPETSQGSAIVELLDADRSYDTLVQGRRYTVFERSYGIYPQVSGKLLIRPIRFQAQLSATTPFSLDPFGAGTRTVVRQSEPVELQIKPVPATYQGDHWLPATAVRITGKWSKNPLDLLPNEPVTHTLMITAQGLTASQLPEIPERLPADFKQYADKPELDNRKTADGITGVRQQKNAVIPARPGEYVLPAISLPWWNTDTQTLEYAVLPERRALVAAAGSAATIGAPELPAIDTGIGTEVPGQAPPEFEATPTTETAAASGTAIWQWLTGILALAWLLTLGYIVKHRRNTPKEAPQPHGSEARKALERACRDDDPQRAKTALLQWGSARLEGAPVSSLGDLERLSNEPLAAEIRNLSRRLYSSAGEPWRGAPLWQAFLQEHKAAAADTSPERGKLEPLFRI